MKKEKVIKFIRKEFGPLIALLGALILAPILLAVGLVYTFGHAVETLAGYGVIKHGEAVSIGMIMAAKVACKLGYCTNGEVDRVVALLKGFGLPIDPPDFSPAEYLSVMQRDKKVKDGQVRLVLNHGIGSAKLQYVENLEMYLNELLT